MGGCDGWGSCDGWDFCDHLPGGGSGSCDSCFDCLGGRPLDAEEFGADCRHGFVVVDHHPACGLLVRP